MEVLSSIPDASEVRRELDLILGSAVFHGSKRCQDFLRYVAIKTLEGAGETLKERTLATEVFGRHATTDLGDDSIVRVGAREVRRRLAQYYVADGAHDLVRIDLSPGSYVPVFHYRDEDTYAVSGVGAFSHTTGTAELHPSDFNRRRAIRNRRISLVFGFAALAVLLAVAGRSTLHRTGGFDLFWAPVFNRATPVLLVLPNPIVYHPSSRANDLDRQHNGPLKMPVQRLIDLPPELLNGSDFVPVEDQYVGFGDTVAAVRVATLLAQHSRSTKLRLASKVDFNDLHDSAPILIGAFTNRWTAEITKDMRFRFAFNGSKPCVVDSAKRRVWMLKSKTDNGRSPEDYLLICRLPRSTTGDFMMIGAGLTVYGTEEAGRIVADPELLTPILRQLPANWVNSDLEFVLHVEVVGDAPALPKLIAVHTW